jgi:hypothetical protein
MPMAETAPAFCGRQNVTGAPGNSTSWIDKQHNPSGLPMSCVSSQHTLPGPSTKLVPDYYKPREGESTQQLGAHIAAYRVAEEDAKGFEDDDIFIPNIH